MEDLSELHWHVAYKLRAEEKLRDRVEHAQTFNNRLTEDINFVNKHWYVCLLVIMLPMTILILAFVSLPVFCGCSCKSITWHFVLARESSNKVNGIAKPLYQSLSTNDTVLYIYI